MAFPNQRTNSSTKELCLRMMFITYSSANATWKDCSFRSMNSAKKQSVVITNMNRLSIKWAIKSNHFSAKTSQLKVKILQAVKLNQRNGSSNRRPMSIFRRKHSNRMGGTMRFSSNSTRSKDGEQKR